MKHYALCVGCILYISYSTIVVLPVLYCMNMLNICKTVFLISYIVSVCDNSFWKPGFDTTVQDKFSLFYLYSHRFIVQRKALYQSGQCFPSIRGESSWTGMNTGINLLPLHSCFIPICPLHSPLFPSCSLPFTLLCPHPFHHSYIYSRSK